MVKINKSLCVLMLKDVSNKDLTLSLVVKNPTVEKDYLNGDEVGLYSVNLSADMWRIETNESEKTCSLISSELKWRHFDSYNIADSIEILGYFVFSDSSVLFYDIFKESVTIKEGKPFYLTPMLTMPYHASDDEDFLSL